MENDQAAYLSNEMHYSQDQIIKIEDDYLWKNLYSHSYSVLFTCENCDHEFDIDGWFYKFETTICPNCKTVYSGIFGKVLSKQTERICLETFEGEEKTIPLPSAARVLPDSRNHIILVLLSKGLDRQNKPWGLIDYSEKKTELKYLISKDDSHKKKQINEKGNKSKSLMAFLLFGALSILGIFVVIFSAFPNIYHF